MSIGTVFRPLKGGLGFSTECAVGTLTEAGQFVLPSVMALISFSQLPDSYILKSWNGTIITVDELRKGLRQRYKDFLDQRFAVGVECQFPTAEKEGHYSVSPPDENTLITAALNSLMDQLHQHRPIKCSIKEVPDIYPEGREGQRFYEVVMHFKRLKEEARVSVIGSRTCRPYYVTWVILQPRSKECSRELWLDPKTGSFLKEGPID